jgi:hypothetical protein
MQYPRMDPIVASLYELWAQLEDMFAWNNKTKLPNKTTTDLEIIPVGPVNFIADSVDIAKAAFILYNNTLISTSGKSSLIRN